MKTEEWVILIVIVLVAIGSCGCMNEDGPDRGYTGYEDISRSINGVAL
jgi:hypothetical protein